MEINPILKAMLLCDLTIVEHETRKRSLIGIFDSIRGSRFPTTHPAMSVYVQFREIEGVFDFLLELYDLEQGKVLNQAVVKQFRVQDRSRDCELVFNLMSVRFDHPGDYEFRIYASDHIFGQKSFKVL
jgi:hypothetical protein